MSRTDGRLILKRCVKHLRVESWRQSMGAGNTVLPASVSKDQVSVIQGQFNSASHYFLNISEFDPPPRRMAPLFSTRGLALTPLITDAEHGVISD